MSVATYTKTGNMATSAVKLDKNIFGVIVKDHQVLKSVYLANLANGRPNLASVKRRADVRGGGAKPWRQKGTGRARFGSSRNPIWRGGGVAFGPNGKENFSHSVNAKTKKVALRQALSLAAHESRIKIIEALVISDGKTKSLDNLLNKLEVRGNVILVVAQKDLQLQRAAKNLVNIQLVGAIYVNVKHVLNADALVIEKAALQVIADTLDGAEKPAPREADNA